MKLTEWFLDSFIADRVTFLRELLYLLYKKRVKYLLHSFHLSANIYQRFNIASFSYIYIIKRVKWYVQKISFIIHYS